MRKPLLAGAIALALVAPSLALGASWSRTAPMTRSPTRADATTLNFADAAWNINNFEIQAGREAESKASGRDYLDYARMIEKDHASLDDGLKQIMQQSRFPVPTALDKEHMNLLQQLSAMTGARFEDQFRTQQIDGHEKAVKLFEHYAKSGQNAELKKWAQSAIPTLEKHLRDAKALPRPAHGAHAAR
jgi:putative membrane protein